MAKKTKDAELKGFTVCFQDSIDAGNCKAGTINFAKKLGLVLDKCYLPSFLVKKCKKHKEDLTRLKIAIRSGLRRFEDENKVDS